MSKNLAYGGQAVIEGVMMRSPRFFSIACRKPDGSIVVREENVERSWLGRLRWLDKPLLRGTLALIDAMTLGMRALSFSASVQADQIGADISQAGSSTGAVREPEVRDAPLPDAGNARPGQRSRVNDIAIGSTMAFAVCFGVVLFVALPTFLTQESQRALRVTNSYALNVVDGVIRIAIFLAYIALIARMDNIRRVFEYHGAEHKAINTFEAGLPLTMENCLKSSRIHPRCGTSFIIVVLLASVLVHCLFQRPPNAAVRIALHVSLIPLVAGVAYEIIRLAGRYRDTVLARWLLAPGLWTQRLTTREPDETQVEVALTALRTVVDREDGVAPAQAVA
jgi:uncharacterized protein YqhQ